MRKNFVLAAILVCLGFSTTNLYASSFKVSIGIRETGSAGDIFGDGGAANGIEWVNRDGQTLTADGTWQLFTFTPASDTLQAFAGATANSLLEAGLEFATLEHIRLLNDMGITQPVRLWIDDVTNSLATGDVVQDFESSTLGTEVMFQEPGFSGSTAGNLAAGSLTAVTDSMAFSGSQSLQMDLQFIDADPIRWARVSTFNTPNQPNPRVQVVLPGAPAPTISFYAKAIVIPEPASLLLAGLSAMALCGLRSRR